MKHDDESLSVSTLLVLALTAVVPVSVATGFSNFERPRQFALACLAGLALVSWGVGLVRRKKATMASPGTVALAAGFAIVVVASLAWSPVAAFGAVSTITWVGLGVVFLVLAAPVGRRPDFLDWSTAVAAGAIGAGALGMYEFFGGGGLSPVWDPSGVAAGFDSIQFASAYYAVVLPLLVGAAAVAAGIRRWFLAAGLLLGMLHFGIVVDIPVFAVMLAVMGVVAIGARPWSVGDSTEARDSRLAVVLAVLTMGTLVVGIVAFDRPEESTAAVDLPRVSSGDFADESEGAEKGDWWYFAADRVAAPVDVRFQSYLNSVTRGLWQKEPILGYGAGGWWLKQTDVVDDSDPEIRSLFSRYPAFQSPFGDYRRIVVEQGGLGLLLFLLWLAGLACAGVAGWRSLEPDDGRPRLIAWSLATSVGTGAALMVFLPVVELVSSGVVWFGAAALLVGESARFGDEGQWLETIDFGVDAPWFRWGVAALSCVIAVAMLVPSTKHVRSALDRGWADHNMLMTDYEEAISLYERAHRRYPAHPEVLYNIALAHHLQGDASEGEWAIDEALQMRPYDGRFQAHAARIDFRAQRIRFALEHAHQAVRTAPGYIMAYELYVAALQRRGRHRDAATMLESLLEREPPIEEQNRIRPQYAEILVEDLDELERGLEELERTADAMSTGYDRNLILDRIEELEMRMERRVLEEEGEPVPPELQPDDDGGHGHDHGPMPPMPPH